MKILTCEQTRIIEKNQVERGSSYFQLMTNAGVCVGKNLISQLGASQNHRVAVLCGKGNNGGDGFITAHYLKTQGMEVYALLIDGEPRTEDSIRAMEQAHTNGVRIFRIWEQEQRVKDIIVSADYVIDAVYGIGFKGALNDRMMAIADLVNNTRSKVLCVDIPSGVNCDSGAVVNTAFRGDITVSFSTLKPCHILYPSVDYCGKTVVAQVGINKGVIYDSPFMTETISGSKLGQLMPKKNISANKGSVGTLSCIGGSYGMAGAAMMCINGALRSGAGMVKGIVPQEIYPMLASAIPQSVFFPYEDSNIDAVLKTALEKTNAVVVGCGMGNTQRTMDITRYVLDNSNVPVILDADALNVLASDIQMLENVRVPVMITPHPGELARLLNISIDTVQQNRIMICAEFAKKYNVITVLKGAYTVVASTNGKVLINPTGNKGMAKAGSGDVLAGIIGSFVAQGMSPENAVISGVYCHGYAGDLAEKQFGHISMLATDIIGCLPECMKTIYTS